ncbi:MAG: class I SAM-dependent methyltransferase [Candidatus Bathyarchaeia archaeon]|jgi:ubiquinone/menaquinone biosynthesis C-methylase UbiE
MVNVINWVELRKLMLSSTHRLDCTNASYWDKCANNYNENMPQMAELTQNQLNRIQIQPQDTLLEVGAGNGRLTVPLAKKAQAVTALEPSKNMLEFLKTNAENAGVHNINCINKSLEDFNPEESVGCFDVVVASFSFFMLDMEKALAKMNAFASNRVYLFLSASRWLDEPELQKLVHHESTSFWADYVYVYNVLYDLDITANIDVWSYTSKQGFNSLDEAVSRFSEIYSIPSIKEDALKAYLQKTLVEDNGKLWFIRNRKAAMIWWNKPQ